MLPSMSEPAHPDSLPTPPQRRPASAPAGAPPRVNPSVYRAVVTLMNLPLFLQGQHVDVHGREHVPPPGTPLVVAANHATALDPFMVARALPPGRYLQFMAKEELFLPVIGAVIRAGGSFPVDRDGNDVQAIRTAVRILQANGTVGIFPQGTRSNTGGGMHGGVALIAAKGRAPILPVGLSRDGRRWVIRFGEPMTARGGIKAVTEELGTRLITLARPVGTRT